MKIHTIDFALKNKCGVYCIRNIVNNKIYVGSSKNLYRRLHTHYLRLENKTHINSHLQNAYNLYSSEKFEVEILEFCDNWLKKEQYWIDFYKPYDREIGYNNTCKVDSSYGYKHTDEAKEKMRAAKLGTKQSLESIKKRAEKLRGKKRTDEQKSKLRESKIGDKNPNFGKKENPEYTKSRMKNMLAAPRWNAGLTKETDERIAKLGLCHIGKIPGNAIKCSLIDLENDQIWSGESMKELSELCPLSLPSLHRLKFNKAGKKITKRYLYYES